MTEIIRAIFNYTGYSWKAPFLVLLFGGYILFLNLVVVWLVTRCRLWQRRADVYRTMFLIEERQARPRDPQREFVEDLLRRSQCMGPIEIRENCDDRPG